VSKERGDARAGQERGVVDIEESGIRCCAGEGRRTGGAGASEEREAGDVRLGNGRHRDGIRGDKVIIL
jgi:hypothetical protein